MSQHHSSASDGHDATIDSCLTDLERPSKHMSSLVRSLKEEVHVFERLYYKSKNQHRSALFWRKAVEARRVSQRLLVSRGFFSMDRLRALCQGDLNASQSAQKNHSKYTVLRHFIASSMHAIYELYALLNKAIDVFESAYKAFELQFRSAKPRSLTLTLIAIVSRMKMLCVELKGGFDTIWSHFVVLSRVLQCDYRGPTKLLTLRKTVDVREPEALNPPHPVIAPDPVPLSEDEDIGNVISTMQTEGPGTFDGFIAPADTALGKGEDPMVRSLPEMQIEMRQMHSSPNSPSPQPDPGIRQSPPLLHEGPVTHPTGLYVVPVEEVAPKQVKKSRAKKRRKRDEIDDIFGTS